MSTGIQIDSVGSHHMLLVFPGIPKSASLTPALPTGLACVRWQLSYWTRGKTAGVEVLIGDH